MKKTRYYKRHGTLFTFAFLVALVFSMLGPAPFEAAAQADADEIASAQDDGGEVVTPEPDDSTTDDGASDDGTTDDGTTDDGTTDDGTTDDGAADDGGDDGSTQLQATTSTLVVDAYVCPADFTDTGDINQVAAFCDQTPPPFDFNVSTGGYDQTQTYNGAALTFFDTPVTNNLRVEPVGQTGAWDAWCFFYDASGNSGAPQYQIREQGAVWLNTFDYPSVACSFYFFPEAEDGVGTIIVNKHFCPAGYEYDMSNPDIYAFAQDCNEDPVDTEFSVYDPQGGYNGGSKTTPGAPDYVSWEDVPTSTTVTVLETVPDGYNTPIVAFCDLEDSLGNDIEGSTWRETGPTGDSFELNLQAAGNVSFCDVFNIPGGKSITIYKFYCDADIPMNEDLDYYEQSCSNEATSDTATDFSVYDTNDTANVFAQGTTGGGDNSWTASLPQEAQSITVEETIKPGYATPIVFCTTDIPNGTVAPEYEQYTVSSNYWEMEYAESPSITCFVFNVYGSPSDIVVYKWFCPEDYDWQAQDADPLVDCSETRNGVNFTLNADDDNVTDLETMTGDSIDGAVQFGGTAPGDYTLVETKPDDVQSAFAFCVITYPDGTEDTDTYPLQDLGGSDDTYTLSPFYVPSGVEIVCHWFNRTTEFDPSADGNTVTIYKWVCPEGTTYDHDYDWFVENCTQSSDDFDFELTSSTGTSSPSINTGQYQWANVPMGDITVTENLENGWGYPVIFCGYSSQDEEYFQDYEFYENGETSFVEHNIPIEEGYNFYCQWFNMPGNGNWVTVNKWVCPEGTDYSQDQDWYFENCTEASNDFYFEVTSGSGTQAGDFQNGSASWSVPSGPFSIQETIPSGWGTPVVYCFLAIASETALADAQIGQVDATGGLVEGEFDGVGPYFYICHWFNIPDYDHDFWLYKWVCPEGTEYGQDYDWYVENCTQASSDFEFKLTTSYGSSYGTPDDGEYYWSGLPSGPFSVQETVPYEYGYPVIYCWWVYGEGDQTEPAAYESTTGYIEDEFPSDRRASFYCYWFNIPGGDGDVTIYKWYCPEGYDLWAYGADPKVDCAEATNGITFYAEGPDGYTSQTDTGDSVDGAVYFGGLEPGEYTFTEEVPPDTAYVFVLDCYGLRTGSIHPYPLSMGDTLTISVYPYDEIFCNWYNVPDYDEGKVTVYKYWCWTKTFTSTANCEIYEEGIEFDLLYKDGSDWNVYDTKTTDGAGKINWFDVPEGEYWLDEHDQKWCAIQTTSFTPEKDAFYVESGKETIVKVYNCYSDQGKQPPTKQPPTKYPNTGVGPQGGSDGPTSLPSFMALSSLLVLALGSIRNRITRFRVTRSQATRGLIAGLLLTPAIAMTPVLAQDDGEDEPIDPDATPSAIEHCLPEGAATPEVVIDEDAAEEETETDGEIVTPAPDPSDSGGSRSEDDEATEDDESSDEEATDDCVRGALPTHVQIEAIDVDADIEYLETVEGVMQNPTTPDEAAWYKETARPGESGNMILAGHLNYWNVPEGVFFAIDTLQPGDEIVVTGADGETHTYVVRVVSQEDATQPPSEEVLEDTEDSTLTLITCGGEWNSEASEYQARTVVKADLQPAEDAEE